MNHTLVDLVELEKLAQNTTYGASPYSSLEFEIHLMRRVEGAIISALAPSFLFVLIAYIPFFISPDVLVVRTSIIMFMLLTM